ncbi:MAG: hypothetical protein IKO19_07850 [Candidatus Riflebacteria bacterium]|nr:hypothetical protein [Candidatus Riflebacteria bacterium]MBR4570559.1 hypothetical protein [Candidatus Riflebacteria bacterium]
MKRMIAKLMLVFSLVFVLCTEVDAAKRNPKEWTFMIFMNADNNLDQSAVKDLKEIRAKGGSNEFMDIVVMVDREKGPAATYYVEGGKLELIKNHGEVDMGDYRVYTNFVKSAIKKYPAKHYCSIIWNHGTGWKAIKAAQGMVRGISYDDQSGNHITTAQLGFSLKDIKAALGRKLDLLCFDACLMQMAEVAYTVREGADYIVGSEETEPGDGYPYKEIFSKMKKGMTPIDVAKLITKEYTDSYDDGSAGYHASTQSIVVSAAYENFKDELNGYAKMLMSSDSWKYINKMLSEVQGFGYPENIDLKHFVVLSKSKIKNPSLKTAADKLLSSMERLVPMASRSGYGVNFAYGLAIYFPKESHKFSKEYFHLPFAKGTMWASMVQDYYKKSLIKPIMEEVAQNKVTKLKEYVAKANENNRDISLELIAKLNFLCFSEQKCDEKTQKRVKALLLELKNK